MTLKRHHCRSGPGRARLSSALHCMPIYHRSTIAPPPSKPSPARGHHCTGASCRPVSTCCHLTGLRLHWPDLLLWRPSRVGRHRHALATPRRTAAATVTSPIMPPSPSRLPAGRQPRWPATSATPAAAITAFFSSASSRQPPPTVVSHASVAVAAAATVPTIAGRRPARSNHRGHGRPPSPLLGVAAVVATASRCRCRRRPRFAATATVATIAGRHPARSGHHGHGPCPPPPPSPCSTATTSSPPSRHPTATSSPPHPTTPRRHHLQTAPPPQPSAAAPPLCPATSFLSATSGRGGTDLCGFHHPLWPPTAELLQIFYLKSF